MKKRSPGSAVLFLVVSSFLGRIPSFAASPPGDKPDVLLSAMQEELQRAQTSLGKLDPAPMIEAWWRS